MSPYLRNSFSSSSSKEEKETEKTLATIALIFTTPTTTTTTRNPTKNSTTITSSTTTTTSTSSPHTKAHFTTPPYPVYSLGAVTFPLLLLTFLLILLLFGWLYSVFTAAKRAFTPEPEDQQQLCPHPEMDPRVLEYRIIFRLGCASPLFNLAKGWVEFLLIEEEDGAPLFQPVRFKAADLRRDALCAELVLVLYRGWALPPLLGVLARHSEPEEVIFFFEFTIYGPEDPKRLGGQLQAGQLVYLGTCAIHDWIRSQEAFFEIRPEGGDSSGSNWSFSKRGGGGERKGGGKRSGSRKRSASASPSTGRGGGGKRSSKGAALQPFTKSADQPLDDFPLMPEMEWEPVEVVFCAVVSVAVLAAVLMALEYFNFYPGFEEEEEDGKENGKEKRRSELPLVHQRGSFYRSLLDVVFSLPVSLALLLFILVGYKYGIKKYLREVQYGAGDHWERFWWWADSACKVVGVSAFVASTGLLAFCGGYLTVANALYWWSALLLSLVLFCGLWTSAERCLPFRRLPCLAGEAATDREALAKVRYPTGRPLYGPRVDPAYSTTAAPVMTSYATAYFTSAGSSCNHSSNNNHLHHYCCTSSNTAAAYGKYGYLQLSSSSSSNSSGYKAAHSTAGPKLVNIKPLIIRQMMATVAKLKSSKKVAGGKGSSGGSSGKSSRPKSAARVPLSGKTAKAGGQRPKTAAAAAASSKSVSKHQKVATVVPDAGMKVKASKDKFPLGTTVKGNDGSGGSTPKSNRKSAGTSISPKKLAKMMVKGGSGGKV